MCCVLLKVAAPRPRCADFVWAARMVEVTSAVHCWQYSAIAEFKTTCEWLLSIPLNATSKPVLPVERRARTTVSILTRCPISSLFLH